MAEKSLHTRSEQSFTKEEIPPRPWEIKNYHFSVGEDGRPVPNLGTLGETEEGQFVLGTFEAIADDEKAARSMPAEAACFYFVWFLEGEVKRKFEHKHGEDVLNRYKAILKKLSLPYQVPEWSEEENPEEFRAMEAEFERSGTESRRPSSASMQKSVRQPDWRDGQASVRG